MSEGHVMKRKGQEQIVNKKKSKLNDQKWKKLETGFGYEGLLSVEVLENYNADDLLLGQISNGDCDEISQELDLKSKDMTVDKLVMETESVSEKSDADFDSLNIESDEISSSDSSASEDEFVEEKHVAKISLVFDDDPFGADEFEVPVAKTETHTFSLDDESDEDDLKKPLQQFVMNNRFPGWSCKLPASMIKFTPANIQKQVFKWYEKNKRNPSQVMIAAQTGSGKTLAFLLPLVHRLNATDRFSSAIVLAPTRELVNQIFDVLSTITVQFKDWRIVKLQGGMSQEKQDRLLRNANTFNKVVIIASPGRLGDLANGLPVLTVGENETLEAKIENIEPVESRLLFKVFSYCQWLALDEYENLRGLDGIDHIGTSLRRIKTISQSNWAESFFISCASATPFLGDIKLLDIIPFKPFLCNINIRKNPNINHFHMDCMTMIQKDLAVYYLHHTYIGKTAIFMNSLDGVRRLSAVLRLLFPNKSVKTVRGDMKMSQRIKVLETFASTKNCILVASDVAARGLDIVDTECVIHYDVPRSGDTYVHRSGRTARFDRKGVAITLCLPTELTKFNQMLKKLEIKETKLIRMTPSICDHLKQRLELARMIEKQEHDKRLLNAQRKEEQEYEEALEIETAVNKEDEPKAELRRKKKQLRDMLTVNVDEINKKRGTTVITPEIFKSLKNVKDTKSFLTLIK